MKTGKEKSDLCCASRSIPIEVRISGVGLPRLHGDGGQFGSALLNGFKEEMEKPGRVGEKWKTQKVSGYFCMVSDTRRNNTHTHTHTHLVSM